MAYSTRFIHDVFFGAPAKELPGVPHEPPAVGVVREAVAEDAQSLVGPEPHDRAAVFEPLAGRLHHMPCWSGRARAWNATQWLRQLLARAHDAPREAAREHAERLGAARLQHDAARLGVAAEAPESSSEK